MTVNAQPPAENSRSADRTAATCFGFTARSKARFVAVYVWSKTIGLMLDVRRGRGALFLYELVYSMCRALGRPPREMRWLGLDRIETRFGVFALRPGTIDAACASPAFERPDVDRLLAELDAYRRSGRDVLFLDVGADLGTYSVTVANRDLGCSVVAFEPAVESRGLLERNLRLNGVSDRVRVVAAACGSEPSDEVTLSFNADEPGSSGVRENVVAGTLTETVRMTTVDAELVDQTVDVVVMKIDVEGYEVPALEGSRETLARARECFLLVEDFVDDAVVKHLHAEGWTFVNKRTPYNSFWRWTG